MTDSGAAGAAAAKAQYDAVSLDFAGSHRNVFSPNRLLSSTIRRLLPTVGVTPNSTAQVTVRDSQGAADRVRFSSHRHAHGKSLRFQT